MKSDKHQPSPSDTPASQDESGVSVPKDDQHRQPGQPTESPTEDLHVSINEADLLVEMRRLLDLSPSELDETRIAIIKERIKSGFYKDIASGPEVTKQLLRDLFGGEV